MVDSPRPIRLILDETQFRQLTVEGSTVIDVAGKRVIFWRHEFSSTDWLRIFCALLERALKEPFPADIIAWLQTTRTILESAYRLLTPSRPIEPKPPSDPPQAREFLPNRFTRRDE